MPCDGKKHIPSNLDDNMELWKKLKDRNDTKITFKGLLAKMKGDSSPNFLRPFVLYTIGKYLFPTTQQYVDNRYLGIVRNVETIKTTNFGQLTLDRLMANVRKFVNGGANLEGNLPLLQYVEDLMRPFIPAQDATLAKPKTDAQAQTKVLVSRVLTDLQEVASLVREAGAEQVDRMYTLEKKMDECLRRTSTNVKLTQDLVKELNKKRDGIFPGVEDVHLFDLGAPSHPMEASVENAEQASDQGKQKEQGMKIDDMEPPMKNLDEDFDVVDAAIELMHHDEPTDTRDGQLIYIERVVSVVKLERDGRIEKCYEDALAGIPITTQSTSYLKHDMVLLPTRSLNVHWFLVVVNPRRKEIQVLDSFFYCTWDGSTSKSSDANQWDRKQCMGRH
ncbi:hypothetical protein ZWY2020_049372 [Hordeum vulgare]|nr:hypothetical protein ZWY2020_049372 [Hordeum vulgare]